MNVILVSHPSRLNYVEQLQRVIPVVTTVIDTVSAWSGHLMALRLALAHQSRVVIMEDDAIPVVGFERLAKEWADLHPDNMLSFYLGTSRPADFQPLVDERMRIADLQGRRELQMPTLLHGVCYSIPTHELPRVVAALEKPGRQREADYAVGAAWGRSVVYPIESLVQHRDGAPVERHPDGKPRTEPRVARRLAGPLMFNPLEK
jgi:hypothetical protein